MNNSNEQWQTPPTKLSLPVGEIHVWRASLDNPIAIVEHYSRYLSEEERARAERFRFTHNQQHFIISRGTLRILLGRYLHISPESILFSYGPFGKPALALSSDKPLLRFNLSHSQGLALYAIARERDVGIDVEYIRPIEEAKQLAARYFSRQENEVLRELTSDALYKQFFVYWTRLEAYLKARGDGLAGLEQRDGLMTISETRNSFTAINEPGRMVNEWSIHDVMLGVRYKGALAVHGNIGEVKFWHMELEESW